MSPLRGSTKLVDVEHLGKVSPSGFTCSTGDCPACFRFQEGVNAVAELKNIEDLIGKYQAKYKRGFTGDRDLLAVSNDWDGETFHRVPNQEAVMGMAFMTNYTPVSRAWDGEMYEASSEYVWDWMNANDMNEEVDE